jgi:hypothetical protein
MHAPPVAVHDDALPAPGTMIGCAISRTGIIACWIVSGPSTVVTVE